MKKIIIIIICIITLGLIGGSIYYLRKEYEEKLTYVILNVNPEIELELNQNNKVKKAAGLDEAGALVLADLNLKDKTLAAALDILMKELIKTGYLNEYSNNNIVIATIVNNDEQKRLKLESEVAQIIDDSLNNQNMASIVAIRSITDEMQTMAVGYNINNGKMLLIAKAMELDESLKEEVLAKQTLYQIRKQIKKVVEIRTAKSAQTEEDLKKAKTNKIQEASQIAAALELAYKLQNKISIFEKSDENSKQLVDTYLKQRKETAKQVIAKVNEQLKKDADTSNSNNSLKYISIKAKTDDLVKSTIKKIIESN